MTNKNSKKLGFSLIELSIVILIIGILVAGVTQGSRLVGRSKLTTAQALTQSSPVTGIKDLTAWFETTLDKSFKSTENLDGEFVTAWYDIQDVANKNVALTSNGAAAAGGAITYQENAINGLPVVNFSSTAGSNYYFGLNLSVPSSNGSSNGLNSLTNTPYTAFYTVRMTSAPAVTTGVRPILTSSAIAVSAASINSSTFFSNTTGTAGSYKICESNTNINNCSNAAATFGTPISQIISVVVTVDPSNSANYFRYIYLNGTLNTPPAALSLLQPPMMSADTTIGKNGTNYFIGDIGEIIVFTRALTDPERKSVECYLSKKWGISVAPNTCS